MSNAAPQTTEEPDYLIIHHLSDLHFHEATDNKGRIAFEKYMQYLRDLDTEQRPHLIVVTGDLTENGDPNDLKILAGILRSAPTQRLEAADGQPNVPSKLQICVVPGPQDIAWDENKQLSFKSFHAIFNDFMLPSLTREQPAHLASAMSELIAYPLNTCFTPESLPDDAHNDYQGYGKRYQSFRQDHRTARPRAQWFKFWRRNKADEMRKALRRRFLNLTEENALAILDAGLIDATDLKTFQDWVEAKAASTTGSGPTAVPPTLRRGESAPIPPRASPQPLGPLKILVTHHPMLVQPEPEEKDKDKTAARKIQGRLRSLLQAANEAGFQLALHGHIHKPYVLSDLSLLEGQDIGNPLRQAGAGSLGESETFNEVRAIYREQDAIWRMEIRTVKLRSLQPSTSLVLLNPVEDIAKRADALGKQAEQMKRFERDVWAVLRQYAETVQNDSSRHEDRDKGLLLPQYAVNALTNLVRDTIFDNEYIISAGLSLKTKDEKRQAWVLKNTFLRPGTNDPSLLYYPASVAAWALALGRPLIYPDIDNETFDEQDFLWLEQSEKLPHLIEALKALQQHTWGSSVMNTEEVKRYERLLGYLEQIRGRQYATRPVIPGKDLYQTPSADMPSPFPTFISIPIPLRSQVLPAPLPEIGTLNINARPLPVPRDTRKLAEASDKPVFTEDRVAMLKGLSDVLAVILCTSNALGNPPGPWAKDRLW